MKTTIEEISMTKRRISVEIPPEEVDKIYNDTFEWFRKEAEVPGFRKGKAPANLIIQNYQSKIENEASADVVKATYAKVLEETKLNPLDKPDIGFKSPVKKGEAFTYDVLIEIYPEFAAKGYTGLKLEKEIATVTDEEVERELKEMQKRLTQLEPATDGTLSPGMVALMDYHGTAGGESFPGSEAKDYVVDFGTGSLMKEIETQLHGMKADEERHVEFDYPQDYFKKELAGKRGAFKFRVKDLRKKIVPEIDDAFAKEIGKYQTISEAKEDIKKRILDFKSMMANSKVKEQAIKDLVAKHPDLEAPMTLVRAELNNLLERQDKQLRNYGRSVTDNDFNVDDFVKTNLELATSHAKGYMIISAIAGQEKIEVTDAEIDAEIQRIADYSKQPIEKVKAQYSKDDGLKRLRSELIFDKALDFVLSQAKIKEVKPKK